MSVLLTILTGTDCHDTSNPTIKQAVAERITALKPTIKRNAGHYCYGGNRCKPENIGWRFMQRIRGNATVAAVQAGDHDDAIVATYHDAARAEHWYRHEKDWD